MQPIDQTRMPTTPEFVAKKSKVSDFGAGDSAYCTSGLAFLLISTENEFSYGYSWPNGVGKQPANVLGNDLIILYLQDYSWSIHDTHCADVTVEKRCWSNSCS